MTAHENGSAPRRALITRCLHAAFSLLIGVVTAVFRTLVDGGLSNDHYMHLAWAQQLRLGDLPWRDFVDPGLPLMYVISAAMQTLWAGPFSEVVLSAAMLGLAASLTCWLIARMTGSLMLGIAGALLQVILQPRLYGYPKLLVPALVLCAVWHYMVKPSRLRLAVLAGATAIGVLLRYDLGVFAGASVGLGLLVAGDESFARRVRDVLLYGLLTGACLAPYLAAIQATEGVIEHAREALEFGKSDAHQLLHRLDRQPSFAVWPTSENDGAATLYYLGAGLAVTAAALVVARRRAVTPPAVVTATAAIGCLLCYSVWIVRHPLTVRIRDDGALLGIVGAAVLQIAIKAVGQDFRQRRFLRPSLTLMALVAVTAIGVRSAAMVAALPEALERGSIDRGLDKMQRRVDARMAANAAWPWTSFWPQGEMPIAVRYLNECVAPRERILLTWSAPEYYFFSQRGFGAGMALFLPPLAFATEQDQQKMIRRLSRETVPLVLINETRRQEFSAAYPLLDDYLRRHYTPSGGFEIRDGSAITIAARSNLTARRSFSEQEWPCDLVSAAAHLNRPARRHVPYDS